jgi:hypothetical protein
MLRRLRRSTPARAVLCLAVLVSMAAAFGLHPEPADEPGASAAAFSKSATVRSGAHACVACLTHASTLPAALAATPHAPQIAEAAPVAVRPLAPPRLARTPCSGLSPPALS